MTIKTFKLPIILLLVGAAIVILGSLFKIMHWPFGNGILIIGMILEVVGLLYLVIKYAKAFNSKS